MFFRGIEPHAIGDVVGRWGERMIKALSKRTSFDGPFGAVAMQNAGWACDVAQSYVHLDRRRLTGIKRDDYAALTGDAKAKAPKKAAAAVLLRIGEIVQRRNDIAHNCDRPKTAKQPLTLPSAKKMLVDVRDFVTILDDHLETHRRY